MSVGKGPVLVFAILFGTLLMSACGTDEAGEENTREERESASEKGRDGSRRADAGKKASDAGRRDAGRADAGGRLRDAGRAILDAAMGGGDDDDDDDGDDDMEPGSTDDDDQQDETGEPSADSGTAVVPKDGGAPPKGASGDVIMTDAGETIYLDPSCANLTPMFAGRMFELVGCCMKDTMKCGLSTHKLMLPAQFASMFPTKCRGYDELAMFMLEPPEEKSCTVP